MGKTDSKEKKIKVPPNKDFQIETVKEETPTIETNAIDINLNNVPKEIRDELINRHIPREKLTHAPSMKEVSNLYEKNSKEFNNFKGNNIR